MSYPRPMTYERTRSGYGPARVPAPPPAPAVRVLYYVPTPAWMRADDPTAPRMTRTDRVGYLCYLVRERHGL